MTANDLRHLLADVAAEGAADVNLDEQRLIPRIRSRRRRRAALTGAVSAAAVVVVAAGAYAVQAGEGNQPPPVAAQPPVTDASPGALTCGSTSAGLRSLHGFAAGVGDGSAGGDQASQRRDRPDRYSPHQREQQDDGTDHRTRHPAGRRPGRRGGRRSATPPIQRGASHAAGGPDRHLPVGDEHPRLWLRCSCSRPAGTSCTEYWSSPWVIRRPRLTGKSSAKARGRSN